MKNDRAIQALIELRDDSLADGEIGEAQEYDQAINELQARKIKRDTSPARRFVAFNFEVDDTPDIMDRIQAALDSEFSGSNPSLGAAEVSHIPIPTQREVYSVVTCYGDSIIVEHFTDEKTANNWRDQIETLNGRNPSFRTSQAFAIIPRIPLTGGEKIEEID